MKNMRRKEIESLGDAMRKKGLEKLIQSGHANGKSSRSRQTDNPENSEKQRFVGFHGHHRAHKREREKERDMYYQII